MSFEKYEEPAVWECPRCGAPNRPGNGRCWSCGKKEPSSNVSTPTDCGFSAFDNSSMPNQAVQTEG